MKSKICCLFLSAILLSPAVPADPVEARMMGDLPSVGRGLQKSGQTLRFYDKGHCVYLGVLKEMPNVIVQHKVCMVDDGNSVITKVDMVATLNLSPLEINAKLWK